MTNGFLMPGKGRMRVIDQSVQPEPLRCTLVKKLLQLIATLLVIFQQFKDCHWAKVVKDGLTDVPVERVSVDYHATAAAFSLCVALHSTVIDRP